MKTLKTILFVLFCLSLIGASNSFAQFNWLRLELSNDFVFQTDKYFTNGIQLEYYSNFMAESFLNKFHLAHKSGDKSFYAITLNQDIFTPNKHKLDYDRPFASYLMLGSKKISVSYKDKLIKKTELNIGILGKYGGGEWIQNSVHGLLPTSALVEGWENQIKTDIVLNYGLDIERGLLNKRYIGISGLMQGKIGLPYTYAGMGVKLRAGQVDDTLLNLGFQLNKGVKIYFFSNLTARYIAYNATIQGGLINSHHGPNEPDIMPFLFEFDGGINLSFSKVKMELGFKQVSPEIKNGSSHRWGYLSFSIAL